MIRMMLVIVLLLVFIWIQLSILFWWEVPHNQQGIMMVAMSLIFGNAFRMLSKE